MSLGFYLYGGIGSKEASGSVCWWRQDSWRKGRYAIGLVKFPRLGLSRLLKERLAYGCPLHVWDLYDILIFVTRQTVVTTPWLMAQKKPLLMAQ